MGNKSPEKIEKDDYENCCSTFNDYFMKAKKELYLEKLKKDILKKIEEGHQKTIDFFIKSLLVKEKIEKILNKMKEVFESLEKQEKIQKNENLIFSENINYNEENIINAIYISKILDDDDINDVKIHDYAVYLYGEDVVEEIEEGNNKNIDEDFKKYNDDDFDITQEEINAKFNEFSKENNIYPENLNKNKYNNDDFFKYYDIIFDINSLENLQKNGWKIESTCEGFEKYTKNKDKKCTLVSVLGNKNTGKSFILSEISNLEIPNGFNISTKGLSIIYPIYEDKNIIFIDTPGLEGPLCQKDGNFQYETNNEKYLKLKEEKKYVSIKDYLTDEEYIEQIMKFIRDKQLTNEFIKRFVIHYSNINIYVVDSELDLEEQNIYKYFLKDKINIIIHNLKTFKEITKVEDYIEEYLLNSATFRLEKIKFTKIENETEKVNKNEIYYKQICEDKNMIIIHLIIANENSEAGKFYNESTINFIKKIIETNLKFEKFPIIEKVKEFLFEHSEDFFKEPLLNIDDIKIIEDERKILKYTGKPYEFKEYYVDELGNRFFIENYKPNYRVYKAKYKDKNGESVKLILNIEISGKVDIQEIRDPKIANINNQNIITIFGRRNLNSKSDNNKKNIGEYKSSYFNDNNNMFNLKICIPNEKCIIIDLFKRIFYVDQGLYVFIFNILDKNNTFINLKKDIRIKESNNENEDEDDNDIVIFSKKKKKEKKV